MKASNISDILRLWPVCDNHNFFRVCGNPFLAYDMAKELDRALEEALRVVSTRGKGYESFLVSSFNVQ